MNANQQNMGEIKPFTHGLQYVDALEPVIHSKSSNAGFTGNNIRKANEIAGLDPEFGCIVDDETGATIHNPLTQIALIAAAIKELHVEVRTLQASLDATSKMQRETQDQFNALKSELHGEGAKIGTLTRKMSKLNQLFVDVVPDIETGEPKVIDLFKPK